MRLNVCECVHQWFTDTSWSFFYWDDRATWAFLSTVTHHILLYLPYLTYYINGSERNSYLVSRNSQYKVTLDAIFTLKHSWNFASAKTELFLNKTRNRIHFLFTNYYNITLAANVILSTHAWVSTSFFDIYVKSSTLLYSVTRFIWMWEYGHWCVFSIIYFHLFFS